MDLTLISKETKNIDGTNYYIYKYSYHAMNGDIKYKIVKRKYTPKKVKRDSKSIWTNFFKAFFESKRFF